MDNSNFLDFLNKATHKMVSKVQEDLGFGYVRLNIDEAQMRQAKQDIGSVEDLVIELLRNSRDANAKNIFVSTSKGDSSLDITVLDDGCGVPEEMQQLIFEPRVTAKLDTWHKDEWGVHGRGMALYSISENSIDAKVQYSQVKVGTSILCKVDTTSLPLLDDQSTYPVLQSNKSNFFAVKSGPHNIIRTIIEFALSEKGAVNCYFGSNIDIIATLRQIYLQNSIYVRDIDNVFCQLATCTSPSSLVDLANKLGLKLSYRSAQRILSGEILPCKNIVQLALDYNKIDTASILETQSFDNLKKDFNKQSSVAEKRLQLTKSDKEKLAKDFKKSVSDILEKNYIENSGDAKISISKNSISIKIDFD
ncbi:MAG: ATP-binding protein [Coriobacteriales bacterium]|nr:ATP-binding protein [Coriobacteriales bacterium]